MLLKNIGKVKILTAGALSCALVAGTGSAALAEPGQSNLDESEVKAMEHAITQSLPTGKLAENSGLSSGAVSKDSPNQINLDGASLSIPSTAIQSTAPRQMIPWWCREIPQTTCSEKLKTGHKFFSRSIPLSHLMKKLSQSQVTKSSFHLKPSELTPGKFL